MLKSKGMVEKRLSIGNDVNGLDTGPQSSPDEPTGIHGRPDEDPNHLAIVV